MFTIEQIEEANSKVKSGADFPLMMQEMIYLGVAGNDVYISDGRAEYFGNDNEKVESGAKYPALNVADKSDPEKFRHCLKIHQEGQTDYPTFCRDSAETGVEKWTIDLKKMTCTYYDKAGNEILTEKIPTV